MKRIITIIAVVASLLVAAGARAQDSSWIGHLSVGVTAGVDGVGFNLATPIGDRFQVRAGYSFMPKSQATFSNYVSLNEPWNIHGNVTVSGGIRWNGPTLFFDWFPAPDRSHFHLTAGLVAVGGERAVRGWTPDPLPIDEEDRATTGFAVSSGTVTTDPDGRAEGFIDFLTPKPYLGIGSGRECRKDSRVSFAVDLGVMYAGRPRAYSFDWTGHAYGEPPKEVEVTSADLGGLDGPFFDFTTEGLIDIARKMRFVPVLRLGLYVKIF